MSGEEVRVSEPPRDLTGGRNIAEYDWLIDYGIRPSRARLHAPTEEIARYYDAWEDGIEDFGIEHGAVSALCGKGGGWFIPGVGSRMGVPRCARCCDLAGIPRGVGSPKNDQACREAMGMPPSLTAAELSPVGALIVTEAADPLPACAGLGVE